MSVERSPPQARAGYPNPQGAVLRRLCQQGKTDLAQQILAAGAYADAAQDDGCTSLWLASEAGHLATVLMLCKHDANVEACKDPGAVTPLYVASQNGHIGIVDVLLMHGANPNTPKANGSSPLHIAAQQGFADVCRVLLRYGAKHSSRNLQGVTPLHLAAYQGHARIVKLLLSAGADPHSESQGKFTMDWADAGGHTAAIRAVIEEHTGEKFGAGPDDLRGHGVSFGDDGFTPTSFESTPAVGTRGAPSSGRGSPKSSLKQPFFVQMRDDNADDVSAAVAAGSRHQMYGWYTPSFLTQSLADPAPPASTATSRLRLSSTSVSVNNSVGAGAGPSPARTQRGTAPASGKAGFAATALPLQTAIRHEDDRNHAFRANILKNPSAGKTTELYKSDPFHVSTNGAVKDIEGDWAHFRRRLNNQAHFLNRTSGSVPDGWMYSPSAVTAYRQEVLDARMVLARAAEEGRSAPPAKRDGAHTNCVGLAEEQLKRLREFMVVGEGAKEPERPPPSHYEPYEIEGQEEPPSPTQLKGARLPFRK